MSFLKSAVSAPQHLAARVLFSTMLRCPLLALVLSEGGQPERGLFPGLAQGTPGSLPADLLLLCRVGSATVS